jgi:hypothetical protein
VFGGGAGVEETKNVLRRMTQFGLLKPLIYLKESYSSWLRIWRELLSREIAEQRDGKNSQMRDPTKLVFPK